MATEEMKEMPKSGPWLVEMDLKAILKIPPIRCIFFMGHDDSNTRTLRLVRQNSLSFLLRFFFSVLLFVVELIGVSF